MNTYLSLLRGINVSGQKKVPMAELKKIYESLKFNAVHTYIQSGNVVFQSKDKMEGLSSKIEKQIFNIFQFEVPVIHKTATDLEKTLNENPFLKEPDLQENKLYVVFLFEEPAKELIEKIQAYQTLSDRFEIIGMNVYLYCPDGYGHTKLNNNFFENKLKVKGTTRNWRSVNELYKLMLSK